MQQTNCGNKENGNKKEIHHHMNTNKAKRQTTCDNCVPVLYAVNIYLHKDTTGGISLNLITT